jgi:hypothetical protein
MMASGTARPHDHLSRSLCLCGSRRKCREFAPVSRAMNFHFLIIFGVVIPLALVGFMLWNAIR